MAAMAATSEIWDRKLVMPSPSVLAQTVPVGPEMLPLGADRSSCGRMYHTASAAVSTCPSTVATAAPIMPQRQPKMNTGSSTMFTSGACQGGDHGKSGIAVGADDGVHGLPEHIKGNAQGDIEEIFLRAWQRSPH